MNFDEFKQFIQVEVDKLDFTKGIFEFDIQINFIENSERTFNELASLLCNKIEKQDGFKWRIEAYMTKQIYYWSHFIQQLYKKDDDHFKSAQVLLQNYQSHRGQLILKIENEGFRAIGFTMQLINGLKDVKELNIDATYKTIKGHFELYGLIGEILNLVFLWSMNDKDYSEINAVQNQNDNQHLLFIDPSFSLNIDFPFEVYLQNHQKEVLNIN
ncbi:hypothetical protein C2G38_2224169 [Gigaspora rosea]|uniref:Uncharacterized protein n=1 Tax=Gigaspora rosea TaxID=44941 RepID=A0A397U0L0_9GLOM|nr:hypothetical protein C2G38_2224169 [Gigaspora rosea]